MAVQLKVPLTGTLGLLVDAKRAGLVRQVAPLIEQLQTLGFRLSAQAKTAVFQAAGEDA